MAAGAGCRSGELLVAPRASLGSAETGCLPPFSAKNSRFKNFSSAGSGVAPDLKTDLVHDHPGVAGAVDAMQGTDKNATSQTSAPAPHTTPDATSDSTPEPAREKFLKREFLAENGGKQTVSAEPSEDRTANKNAPHRQPAAAAKTPNAPWTLNTQKACQPPVSLATENSSRRTPTDDVQK